jgi:hypothetical protein
MDVTVPEDEARSALLGRPAGSAAPAGSAGRNGRGPAGRRPSG